MSTVPFEATPALYRHLTVLVTGLFRFLAPAFYCRSWAPWCRLVLTVLVVVVLVLVVRAGGAPPSPMM